jgi:hypothetical protein
MPSIGDKKDETATLNVERDVLHALLHIPVYKYGTRSMEAIIKMGISEGSHIDRFAESTIFTRSMIPPPAQLEMHVDAARFYELMDEFPDE